MQSFLKIVVPVALTATALGTVAGYSLHPVRQGRSSPYLLVFRQQAKNKRARLMLRARSINGKKECRQFSVSFKCFEAVNFGTRAAFTVISAPV